MILALLALGCATPEPGKPPAGTVTSGVTSPPTTSGGTQAGLPTSPPTGTTPTVGACAGGPLQPLPAWPVASTASPSQAAALGADLEVTGAVAPGAQLTVTWPATDGDLVDFHVGSALLEDCAAVAGDGCLWVDGPSAVQVVAANGVASATIPVDPGLLAGQAVAVQATVDGGLVSPVWYAVYDAAAVRGDPLGVPGVTARLFPGTYTGLYSPSFAPYHDFAVWADAGETVGVVATWPPLADPDDEDVIVFLDPLEGPPAQILDVRETLYTGIAPVDSSQWVTVAVSSNNFYETAETSFDLRIGLLPPTGDRAWYADADADGYGEAPIVARTRPAFAADVGGDCDDGAGDLHPGADEICDDGIDADCDGRDDCATVLDGPGPAARRIDAGIASFIREVAAPGDLTGDGIGDLLVSLPNETHLLPGPLPGDVDVAAAQIASFGAEDVVGVGDLTGDGVVELAVPQGGLVAVLAGPFAGAVPLVGCGVSIDGGIVGSSYAPTPAPAGDTDGDGRAELLLAGPFAAQGGSVVGVALVRDVTASRLVRDGDVVVTLTEPIHAGTPIDFPDAATPDLDGDGLADLAIWHANGGELITLTSPLAPSYDRPPPTQTFDLLESAPGLAVGDWDGDGDPDLGIGADLQDHVSTFAILTDPAAPPTAILSAPGVYAYSWEWDHAASAGDLDGDGFDDLVLSPETGGVSALWVPGPLVGAIDVEAAGVSYAGVVQLAPSGDVLGAPGLVAWGAGAPGGEGYVWLLGGIP